MGGAVQENLRDGLGPGGIVSVCEVVVRVRPADGVVDLPFFQVADFVIGVVYIAPFTRVDAFEAIAFA